VRKGGMDRWPAGYLATWLCLAMPGLEGGCRKAVVCFREAASQRTSALRNRQGHNLARVHVTSHVGESRLAAPLSHALDVLEEIWFACWAAIGVVRWTTANGAWAGITLGALASTRSRQAGRHV
jgi:hypothetical protein